jgi:ferredoxin
MDRRNPERLTGNGQAAESVRIRDGSGLRPTGSYWREAEMKVRVDVSRCESNAICLGLAPEVFDLDDDGLVVLRTDEVGAAAERRVRSAVAACPRAVISAQD